MACRKRLGVGLTLFLFLLFSFSVKGQGRGPQSEGFTVSVVSDSLVQRMRGGSLPEGARIQVSELRHLRLRYVDFAGRERVGEMVCNKAIAEDLIYIFQKLYEARYPIASIRLIDDFGADDELSMRANNTSCFCYREVSGTRKLSKHALGMAVDLNPLQNPCVRMGRGKRKVEPSTAGEYVNRGRSFEHKIDKGDLAYRLFTERGFLWGGNWRTVKDYQHFEKR